MQISAHPSIKTPTIPHPSLTHSFNHIPSTSHTIFHRPTATLFLYDRTIRQNGIYIYIYIYIYMFTHFISRFDCFVPAQVQPDAVHVLQHRRRLSLRQPHGDELLVGDERDRPNDARRQRRPRQLHWSLFRLPGSRSAPNAAQSECDSSALSRRLDGALARLQFRYGS